MRAVAAVLLMIFLSQPAFADILKLKSGEKKEGRILAQSDGIILFQDKEGLVSEVPDSNVSIIDRSGTDAKVGRLSFYTSSPQPKKKKTAKPPSAGGFQPDYSAILGNSGKKALSEDKAESFQFEMMDKMLQAWLDKHPEALKFLETAASKAIKNSANLDDLVTEAKKGSA